MRKFRVANHLRKIIKCHKSLKNTGLLSDGLTKIGGFILE